MSFIANIRNSKWLKKLGFMRGILKTCFRFTLRLFTGNKGIKIHIGQRVHLRLDYRFYFNKYEQWGANHNDGYNHLLDHCHPGSTVIDVGAHIGLCALSASHLVGDTGQVIAFEPSQTNCNYLKKHIHYNNIQNTQIYPYLVGEVSKDQVDFYESSEPTGMNAIVHYKSLPNATWVQRRQISIDDFCEQHHIIPTIIKIDVEGAEIGVLKGAQKTLTTHTPLVIISIHPKHLSMLGETEHNLRTTIKALNYEITDMAGKPVESFELKEYIMVAVQRPVISQ